MPATPATSTTLNVIAHRGTEAAHLLASSEFHQQWRKLLDECPWATCMQSPEFAGAWYECYAEVYEPLLITGFTENGQLCGCLSLAIERATRNLTFAGSFQAEYTVWLSRRDDHRFISDALHQLSGLGFSSLRFQFLPPGTPLEWLNEHWGSQSVVQAVRRPLMGIGDGEAIRASFLRKKNRRRMRELERFGPVEFVELRTEEEFDRYYQQMALYTDFRQGAISNSYPFTDDPNKGRFFRALMRHPGLIHATVTRRRDELIAAHLGFRNRRQVMLGVIAHSPFLAAQSPGRLHIMQLGLLLHAQGISELDLTPGGDAYKELFATHSDEAHVLTIFFDRGALLRQQAIQRARQWGKSTANAAGITPERLRAAARFSKRLSKVTASPRSALPTLFHLMKRRLWETQEIRLYRIPASRIDRQYQQDAIRCNCVMDLLCYQPAERWQPSKRAFLSMAMSRFEEGLRVYTHAQEGRLVHYGWLTLSAAKSFLPEVQATYEYPQGSAVLWDFYTDPAHRGKGLYSRSLRQMLRDAAAAEGTEFAYIAVLADNTASRKVIEKAGFEHQASIILRRRLHRVSHTRHSVGG